jgi:hypothetical protein
MPYYVFAIQTDSKLHHLCGTFVDYRDAEICEKDQSKTFSQDKSFVKMIYAQNQTHARQRMKEIQRESKPA